MGLNGAPRHLHGPVASALRLRRGALCDIRGAELELYR